MDFQSVFGRDLSEYAADNSSGIAVDAESAMQVSAVFACVRILSDNVSTLPLDIFNRNAAGARVDFNPRPQWSQFSPGQLSKIDLLSQVVVSLKLDGNAFLAIYRDAKARIIGIEVLDPAHVTVEKQGGRIVYRINGGEALTSLDILHIRDMTMPGGLRGMSPIRYARESLGLSLAATQYGAAFFGNGALPGMTVEVPGELSATGIKQLKRAWQDTHQGSGNAHKLAVLTEGAKFAKVSIDPEDAQFLQTRQFQVPDVARIYGVPPHLIGDASNSTSWGSGLAEQNSTFVQHTLRPLVERIEAGLNTLLLSEGLPPTAFVKLSVDGLLRGDHSQRISSYTAGLAAGFYTIAEVRAWEDLPPLPEVEEEAPAEPVAVEADAAAEARAIAEVIQKVYLGVGKIVTDEEARALVSMAGFPLPGGMPEEETEPVPDALVNAQPEQDPTDPPEVESEDEEDS